MNLPVRPGRDVQPGFTVGLHLFWQGVLLLLFFIFFVAGGGA